MIVVLITEAFYVRGALTYAVGGAVVGLACYLGLIPFDPATLHFEGIVRRHLEIMTGAGIVAGVVYWMIAGRNAGAWRQPPRPLTPRRRCRRNRGHRYDVPPASLRNGFAVILRSGRRPRLEGWPRVRLLHPSFETLAEFSIGPRFARTRWQAPQDDGHAVADDGHNSTGLSNLSIANPVG